jgi:outer membrane protein insertion porin family
MVLALKMAKIILEEIIQLTQVSSTFPNPLPDKWNANSIVFFDAGNVWGVDYDSSKDSDKIRSSVGIGLDWISPLGPLSFYICSSIK